ncbi:MobA protein [uncultured Bacteroides sp.]|uniref:plasmid mobilization protein n=1 Tax=uncultured Bacteroides sp. TaxID=162156 RepID=UPI00259A076E|nr:MobA protein [uncultured Bacteroides sp.]
MKTKSTIKTKNMTPLKHTTTPQTPPSGQRKVGRPRKANKKIHRVAVRFTAEENIRFLTLFERSGKKSRSEFLADKVLNTPMKIIRYDKTLHDFIVKLSSIPAQVRAIGNNYNQVMEYLFQHFERKKALRLLYPLERAAIELAKANYEVKQQIQQLLKYDCEDYGR